MLDQKQKKTWLLDFLINYITKYECGKCHPWRWAFFSWCVFLLYSHFWLCADMSLSIALGHFSFIPVVWLSCRRCLFRCCCCCLSRQKILLIFVLLLVRDSGIELTCATHAWMAHPAHLQLPQLVFDELIGRAGQRLSTQVDEAPKIIQNPKNCISFFFSKVARKSRHISFGFFFARFGPCARTNNKRGRKRKKKIFLAPSKCFVWRECVLYAVVPPPK